MENTHVLPILERLKRGPGRENDEKLKDRLRSATTLMDEFLIHLVACQECLMAVNHFFLTQACSHILTPKAAKVLSFRRIEPEDGIYLIGLGIPSKATLQYHDTILVFIAPNLEIHQAVRKFKLSIVGADLPPFSDIGVESKKLRLYRMSSQGHYESFNGFHGKRTVVDILAQCPNHNKFVASR